MKSKIYIVEDEKMQFNFNSLKFLIASYCKRNKITNQEAERSIAEKINVSSDTVHKWHYGMSSPTDIELIKEMSEIFGLKDFITLLKNVDGRIKMAKLTDRQMTAAKKIYDIFIWFLKEFSFTNGFNDYWYDLKEKGWKDPESGIYDKVSKMHSKIEVILDKEYFDLKDTDIYNEFCEFANEDLYDIYNGKVSYAYRFEAEPDGNPTTSEDYDKAMIKLNSIIDKYI